MPRFYMDPKVSKKLMELSGGNLNHPIIEKYCRARVGAQIKAENHIMLIDILKVISVLTLIFTIIFLIARL